MSFCPAMPGSANDDGSSDSNPHAGLNPLEGVVPHEYQGLLFWAGLSTVTYPLENAKILIQVFSTSHDMILLVRTLEGFKGPRHNLEITEEPHPRREPRFVLNLVQIHFTYILSIVQDYP